MHIPVAIGLIGPDGKDLIGTEILHLRKETQNFTIENVPALPTPSILRNFSAPVYLETDLSDDDYSFLTKHEIYDGFNRWEAGQHLDRKTLNMLTDEFEKGNFKPEIPEEFLNRHGDMYKCAQQHAVSGDDLALYARSMTLPDVSIIIQKRQNADPVAAYKARQYALAALKRTHKGALQKIYKANEQTEGFSISPTAMAKRAIRNVALSILTCTQGTGCAKLAKSHYFDADNMTDRMAALAAIASNQNTERDEVLQDFYQTYRSYPLVIDKWFSVQASSVRPDIISHLKTLRAHADFTMKNPNRVRSLFAAFAMNNYACFHAEDGSGYNFLADAIIELNSINPQIAARLLTPMRDWRKYSTARQANMKDALERILQTPDLSPDVYEIVSKSLK